MRKRHIVVCVAIVLGAIPAGVAAWGSGGHRILCQIAWERLTPAGRNLVEAIRADRTFVQDPLATACAPGSECAKLHDGRQMTFQDGCTWPDESREDTYKDTYDQHFVNVPRAAPGLDLARDCAALDCAVAGIQRHARYLAIRPGSDREKERRVLALRFLGHFVGDLHQPLHAGYAEDLGGNTLFVRFNDGEGMASVRLHSVWDSGIMKRAGLARQTEDGHALNLQITNAELQAWQDFDIAKWARESHALVRTAVYVNPNGQPVQANDELTDQYFTAALPLVRQQLKKGGVRLAHIINAAAAGTLPANLIRLQ